MIEKEILVVETQYFPAVDYFKKLKEGSYVEIEQWENFQKMSYRNRCTIVGSNGLIDLTIPVVGGREQKRLIKEVEIDNSEHWQKRHVRSITSSYAKAAFFEYYISDVINLIEKPNKFLLDLNMEILEWLIKKLKLGVEPALTPQYRSSQDNLLDFRNTILPRNQAKIGNEWEPKYMQVFSDRLGFVPNLSVLDLLFCEGPNAGTLINSFDA